MAKLTGVKIIDMQGGEITKVAHGGAEYELFEGMPQVGDLIRPHSDHWGGSPSGFYACHSIDAGGDAKINTEASENDAHFRRYYDVFRKVKSAEQVSAPFAEMITAKVDAVEKRVEALEGASNNETKPTVGAFIRVIKSNTESPYALEDGVGYGKEGQGLVKIGAKGEIVEVTSKGIFAKFSEDDMISGKSSKDRFYLENGEYEAFASDKPQYKTVKRHAKVGERILITRELALASQTYKLNDVLTVTKANDCAYGDVEVEGQVSFVDYEEYEVIVEDTADKPAQEITHKGAKYALVTRKAQPGDVVVFTENTSNCFTNGVTYGPAVIRDGELRVGDDDGDLFGLYRRRFNRTEANTLVYAPKPKTGDIVVITANTNSSRNKVGDIGKVVDAPFNDSSSVTVDVPGRPASPSANGNYTRFSDMRLATPAEIAQYHKAADITALKEGDFITIDTLVYPFDITEGKAYEVRKDDHGRLYFVDDDGDERYVPISAGAFAKAEAPGVFANLGRKPNEFKEGDIVSGERSLNHGEVVIGEFSGGPDDKGNYALITFNEGDYRAIKGHTLELIAPVESRVDTK